MKLAESERSPAVEMRYIEAMRSVIDRKKLTGTSAIIFDELFPSHFKRKVFNSEDIKQHKEAEYDKDIEKPIADACRHIFGFASSKEGGSGKHDMPDYRVSYTNNPTSFICHLNELPILNTIKEVTVTSPLADTLDIEHPPAKMNRADHSKIIAAAIFRDVIRMAIKTPGLFLKRVEKDVGYFEHMGIANARQLLLKNPSYVESSIRSEVSRMQAHGQNDLGGALTRLDDPILSQALSTAIEYSKYLMLFAYLHDSKTPAYSDIVMKASGRFPGQSRLHYSEDTQLKKDIELMTDEWQGAGEHIFPLFGKFDFDRNMFVTMTQSYCEENDPTLGAVLIKGKRKMGFATKGGPLELEGSHQQDRSVFDRDQVEGTKYNLFREAQKYLPGSVAHMFKNRVNASPIGSYTERLQLLAYAMATGISKKDLAQQLIQNGIPPEELHNVCIASEELDYGPNFLLMETPFEGEILPVALEARPLKRILYSFAALTFFNYQGDRQAPVERLFQDIITAVHQYQLETPTASMYGDKQMTDTLRLFVNSNDQEAASLISKSLPTLNLLFPLFLHKARRLTEPQLDIFLKEGKKALISRAPFRPSVSRKEGSLIVDSLSETGPAFYYEIIRDKLSQDKFRREPNPDSLPNLLDGVDDVLREEPLFLVIELSDDDLDNLLYSLEQTTNPIYRGIVTRALRYWTQNLNIMRRSMGNEIVSVSNDLAQAFVLPYQDDPAIKLAQEIYRNNIEYLNVAQEQEYSNLNV